MLKPALRQLVPDAVRRDQRGRIGYQLHPMAGIRPGEGPENQRVGLGIAQTAAESAQSIEAPQQPCQSKFCHRRSKETFRLLDEYHTISRGYSRDATARLVRYDFVAFDNGRRLDRRL